MEVLDLVAIARFCDAVFDGNPSVRDLEPELFAVVDDGDALSIWRYGPVDHETVAHDVVLPATARAVVLTAGGWVAPSDDGDTMVAPSLHPLRRRVHATTVVGNDGEIVAVLRTGSDPEPRVVAGACEGRVPAALVRCWQRHLRLAA